MSRPPVSRASLYTAALGALAIAFFGAAPTRASEDAVVIPTLDAGRVGVALARSF